MATSKHRKAWDWLLSISIPHITRLGAQTSFTPNEAKLHAALAALYGMELPVDAITQLALLRAHTKLGRRGSRMEDKMTTPKATPKATYFVQYGDAPEREVTVTEFMQAEASVGFRGKFPGQHATGGFGGNGISGRITYSTESVKESKMDTDNETRPLLSDTEVLETMAEFAIEIKWEKDEDDDEAKLEVTAFPSATGGTWFHRVSNIEKPTKEDRTEMIREVVSDVRAAALARPNGKGSISAPQEIFGGGEEGADQLGFGQDDDGWGD